MDEKIPIGVRQAKCFDGFAGNILLNDFHCLSGDLGDDREVSITRIGEHQNVVNLRPRVASIVELNQSAARIQFAMSDGFIEKIFRMSEDVRHPVI